MGVMREGQSRTWPFDREAGGMDLSKELGALRPIVRRSPLAGFEHVRGFGVFGLPFTSGHVLALRAFPENDFAPYVTVWHRTPGGDWSIFVDGPRLDIACPRSFGAATRRVQFSRITLTWTQPNALRIQLDRPRLLWHVSMAAPHDTMLLPERMFVIDATDARLEDQDLGAPTRGRANAAIGAVKLPARPIFAVGQAYFRVQDQAAYERTVAEMSSAGVRRHD